jgi:hypothetical protein
MSLERQDAGSADTGRLESPDQYVGPGSQHQRLPAGGLIRRLGLALAGPALIVVSVLIVLRGFAFGGEISNQHVDVLAYQLPLWCFMGRSLSAGHIPAWNPYAMGGFPSAADGDSGWMYAPVMILFGLLPCGTAMRWFIVLQPIIAGLGLYWFLRGEGLSRLSSTFGGLVLSLAVAGAMLTIWLAFAAIVAWIPVLLGAASRLLRAPTWPGRLVWIGLAALAWGQLSAAFLGSGVVLGTVALIGYGLARTVVERRSGRLGRRDALLVWGLLILALPLANFAYFLPRLVVLSRTSIAFGYGELQGLGGALSGTAVHGRVVGPIASPVWPVKLAISPGMYLGALPLAFCFAAWWSRRYRYLVIALSLLGLFSYLATLRVVALHLFRWFRTVPLSDIYFHSPVRFAFLLFPAAAALVAIGLETWRESQRMATRGLMLLPGVVLWGGPLLAAHIAFPWLHLLVAGVLVGGIVLAVSIRRPAVLLILPLLLAVELVRGDLAGQSSNVPLPLPNIAGSPLHAPTVDASIYLRAGPIEQTIRSEDSGRILGMAPGLVTHRGYLTHQSQNNWGLLVNQRGMLFDLEDIQGYNSIQLKRYWRFVRAVSPIKIDYNAGVFAMPPPIALNLLQVRWVIGPPNEPLSDLTPVEGAGKWTLYERANAPPRASVLTSWRVVDDWDQALREVVAPGFDPDTSVVLERDPGFAPQGSTGLAGTATYQTLGTQAAQVVVEAPSAAVVLVRNPYDANWHATVDGHPSTVFPADYLVQGIPVPAGHHVIRLTYDDPSIGWGLVGSVLTLIALFGAAGVLRARARPASVVD